MQPLQRGRSEVETRGAFLGHQPLQPLALVFGVHTGPVLAVRWRRHVPVHHLQWLVQPVPVERGPQRGMRGEHLPPGLDQRAGVQGTVDDVDVLAEVHVRRPIVHGVQQHPPL